MATLNNSGIASGALTSANIANTQTSAPALGGLDAKIQSNANSINQSNQQFATLMGQIKAEQAANAPGVAPTLNLNSIQTAAQQAAKKNVNPLYSSYLNQYLQQETANKQAANAQNKLNVQSAQTGLQSTLAQNQLAQTQAAGSNQLTQNNIGAQQTNYELASGNAQNQKLDALQQNVGQGNLGASGLGQQKIFEAENARNAADAAQRGQFQYQRDANNLSTQDTFAQLAQSSKSAVTAEGQQEQQFNFNLNDYLRQAAYNDSQYKQANEASRQQALTAQSQQYQAQAVQKALQKATPAGSKAYVAGEGAYNNYLNPSSSLPGAVNQNSYLQQIGSSL